MQPVERTLFWVSGDTRMFGYMFGFFSSRIHASLIDIDNEGAEFTHLQLTLTCGTIMPTDPKHVRYVYVTNVLRDHLYELESDFTTYIKVTDITEEELALRGYKRSAEIFMWALGWDTAAYRPIHVFNEDVNQLYKLKAGATAPRIQEKQIINPSWIVDDLGVEFLVDDIIVCVGIFKNHTAKDVVRKYWTILDFHDNDEHAEDSLKAYIEYLRYEIGNGLTYNANYPKLWLASKVLTDRLNTLRQADAADEEAWN